ncbi:MAG: VOC family protein [Eubacteriales bacterium]
MHFQHLALRVNNLEKSIEFYETITELTVSRRLKVEPGEIAFMTNGSGETEIELVCLPNDQKFEGKGLFLCFVTDKLDVMRQLALDNGYNPSKIQEPDPQSRYFYVYDPDGLSVQLKQKSDK